MLYTYAQNRAGVQMMIQSNYPYVFALNLKLVHDYKLYPVSISIHFWYLKFNHMRDHYKEGTVMSLE